LQNKNQFRVSIIGIQETRDVYCGMVKIDEIYMSEALREARKAAQEDEVPVGCVIVQDRKIIARGHNQVERLNDPTAHAEMIAITSAASYLGSKWLNGVSIYVTIEPCSMCAGAFVLARIKRLIYGADDPKTGACGSVVNIINNNRLNHRIKVKKGVLEQESSSLLKDFFKKKRTKV
jgi:tRNA(adenine34) deaminase